MTWIWTVLILRNNSTTLEGSVQKIKRKMNQTKANAEDRNRTSDTGIFSPLLYRLSYLGICLFKTQLIAPCQDFMPSQIHHLLFPLVLIAPSRRWIELEITLKRVS